jgi:hypothetical protein
MWFCLQSNVEVVYRHELVVLYSRVDLKDQRMLVSVLALRFQETICVSVTTN